MFFEVAKLQSDAIVPGQGTSGSAGFDLYYRGELGEGEYTWKAGDSVKIDTGIAVSIPIGYCGFIIPRSSWGTKGVVLKNTIGVIDSDYRGPLVICAKNCGDDDIVIKRGDRICQLVLVKIADVNICEVSKLDDTIRGDGGFGSTGK